MNVYSELTRNVADSEEALFRVVANDLVEFVSEPYLAEMRAKSPSTIITNYSLIRFNGPGSSDDVAWAAYCTAHSLNVEIGYVHTGGVRNTIANGWQVMNVGRQELVDFWTERILTKASGYDGVCVDLTLYYPEYDTGPGTEQIEGSDEYPNPGDAELYRDATLSSFVAIQAALKAGLPGRFLYPNFGALTFLDETDDETVGLIATSDWILAQIAFSQDATDTAFDKTTLALRLGIIASILAQQKHLLCQFYDVDPGTAKSRILAAALFALVDDGSCLFARYADGVDKPEHVREWEFFPLLRSPGLGPPAADYMTSEGGRLFSRQYSGGAVYVWAKASKNDPSDQHTITTHEGDYLRKADGSLSLIGAPGFTLDSNEGAIVIAAEQVAGEVVLEFDVTPDASVGQKVPNVADSLIHTLLDEGYPPGDTSDYVRNGTVGQYLELASASGAIPTDLESVYEVGIELLHDGQSFIESPAADVEWRIGEVKIAEKATSLITFGQSYGAIPFAAALGKAVLEELGIGSRFSWRAAQAGDEPPIAGG